MIAHHNHSCQKEKKNGTYFAVQHQKGHSYIGLPAKIKFGAFPLCN